MKVLFLARAFYKSLQGTLPLLLLLLPSGPAVAELTAVTEEGREVILSDNGTWKYHTPPKNTSSKFHFRKTQWGMSPAEVQASEGNLSPVSTEAKPDTSDILRFKDTVAGLEVLIDYVFIEEKLVRARYRFQESHINKNLYIDDFTVVSDAISTKYSKPQNSVRLWLNDLYKKSYQEWGNAVSAGHLTMADQWETADTAISVILRGVNNRIEMFVDYKSKALAGLRKRDKNTQFQDVF